MSTRTRAAGHSYSYNTVRETLFGTRKIDWIFVQTIVTVFHHFEGLPGEPDLAPWRQTHEQSLRHTHWIGSPPDVAAAYQSRPVALEIGREFAPGRTEVLTGLGGVGKTQLAADLVFRSWTDHLIDLVMWADATSRTSILAALAEVASRLAITVDGDEEELAERVLDELAKQDGRRWLLVFDDLRDPDDLKGLWPRPGNGITVVTTRCRHDAMSGSGRTIRIIDAFEPEESMGYLREKLDGEGLEDAAQLARVLGHLPLGLDLAGAYMKDHNLDCTGYLRRFQEYGLGGPLATTWNLSIDTADGYEPKGGARLLLQLAAVLDSHGIPAELFTTEAVRLMLGARLGRLVSADDASDALSNLTRLSLGMLRDHRRVFGVHPLVQRAVREVAPDLDAVARCAADALVEIWPDSEDAATFIEQLRSNAEALRRNAEGALWQDGLHGVVFRAGNSLTLQGLPAAALAYWRELLPLAVDRLGADHPDTLSVRNNYAWALHRTENNTAALAELSEVLTIRYRVLGADDDNTLATRHGVAVFQGEAGDLRGAVDSLRALAVEYDRLLGPDSRDTLNTRMNLACMLGDLESPKVAVAHLRELLDRYRRVLGPDHPETLDVELYIAGFLAADDAIDEAWSMIERLPEAYRVALGPDHVVTLRARFYAADLRGRQGRRAEAAGAMQNLLDDLQPLLGKRRTEIDEICAAIERWSAAAASNDD